MFETMYSYPSTRVSRERSMNGNRKRWVVFLACLFLGQTSLVIAIVVYHLPPLWFGYLFLLLLICAFFAARYFLIKNNTVKKRVEPSNELPVDASARRRLVRGLASAKFFLCLYLIGFFFVVRELVKGSLNQPWWIDLGCVLIGLLLLIRAIKQVIYFRKKLSQGK